MINGTYMLHNFDVTIETNGIHEVADRSLFFADESADDDALDTFGTLGSAGTFGGCFGCFGTAGCCC